MRKVVSSLLALGIASASAASAATYYVPRPYLGGYGKSETKLEVSKDGPRIMNVTFIPEGEDGRGLQSRAVRVDNSTRPGIFDVSGYVTGPGFLKLVGDPGLEVRVGTVFLDSRTDSLAWVTPILTESNWFRTGETAHLKSLARTATGHSNVEIINFSSQIATCQLQIRRPKGSPIGSPRTIPVKPFSHELVEDPLLGVIAGAVGAGLRAEVSCNQPFYSYGTFVDPSIRNFRLLYPLETASQPVVETVSLDRPGVFFAPTSARPHLLLDLPLVPERGYRAATIEFDVNIRQFTPIFTGLVGMFHAGGARFNKTLYFGTFIRGLRSKTMVDLGSAVLEPTLKVGTGWQQNALHHVTLVYDTESATMRMRVTRNGNLILDVTGSAYHLDLADRGNNPVKLSFGLPGVADHAYYPPVGWRFSDLKVRVTR